MDHCKREIARYEKKKTSHFSGSKKGMITLLAQGPQIDMNIDMILVTGLAWIEYRRRSDEASSEGVEGVVEAAVGV